MTIKFILILTISLLINSVFAQPFLTGVSGNTILINYCKTHNLVSPKSTDDTLKLPFFDDFAKPTIYPNNELWLDKSVFINTNFGDNPPSIGVATFDALNYKGRLHDNVGSNAFLSDTLTSKLINLDYLPSDSVYFSFFYQARGLAGNAPEVQDSLILEFKTGNINWTTVWWAVYDTTHDFKEVMIPITDAIYLKNSFQFRFKNYASVGGNSLPAWSYNSDYWNIDYIYLDTARVYNIAIDDYQCMLENNHSFLKNYSEMPASHYNFDKSEENHKIKYHYKNYSNTIINMNHRFIVSNYSASIDLGNENVDPNSTIDIMLPFDSVLYQQPGADTIEYKIKFYLRDKGNNIDDYYKQNDTAIYFQNFYNYYAYDDGTPESGFGLAGTGTEDAMLAYKYFTYKPDSLRAIQMYFNPTRNNYTENLPFYLTVWDIDEGGPNNIIYQESTSVPIFKDSLYQFVNYKLKTPLFLTDSFYIGWKQIEDELLNIGFDNNTDSKNKTYYNIDGSWTQSTFEGSLMMRPVFGKKLPLSINNTKISNIDINIYPNPANNIINIEFDKIINNGEISIYNSTGYLVKKEYLIENSKTINLSDLNNGLYFIKITENSNIIASKKVLVIH